MDAIADLGASLASGEDSGAYAEAFSKYAERMGYKWVEKIIPARIRSAANGSVSNERLLKNNIAEQLRAEGQEISGIDDLKVIEEYNKLIAGYRDSLNDNINRYFELAKKQLEGTLTESEKLELNTIELPENWQEAYSQVFENEALSISDKWLAFIKALISSSPGQWSEIEGTVKKGYDEIFKNLFKEKAGKETDI